jgi:HJR/Mrr/RecB family endonuclease
MLAPRAAGFGLTLHAANHVIHLNRWWNPAVEDQCTDRAYRIGQMKDVTVWIPIAEHPVYGHESYDVFLDQLLEKKRKVSGDVIVPVRFDPSEMAALHSTVFGETPLQNDVATMDWKSFEEWTIQKLVDAGFITSRTPPSGDAGADSIIRLRMDQTRGAIIQVKHRSRGKVGVVTEREVVDVLRARDRYDLPNPAYVLVTNGSVEPAGMAAAKWNGITIIDFSNIEKIGDVVRSALRA